MSNSKHELKICVRCDGEFECKSGSIHLCQCQSVSLDAKQLQYVHDRYEDCLCVRCLQQLKTEYSRQQFKARLALYSQR